MKMVKDLEKLKPGDHFMLKDIEWVCLDPDYTEYDGQKGIFAIMAKLNGKSIKFCDDESRDDWSNYTKSPIRTYLEKEYGEKLKDVTLVHKCDLRTDNGDEMYPPVYDKVFILSIFEYFQYVNYIPRYDDWHRLRSATRGNSYYTWNVYTSGGVTTYYAVGALQCAPACVIQKSNNLRPTPRSQKKKATNMKNKFEIYEGRTEMNRVKKYVVADAKADYVETVEFAKKLFKCSEAHITVEPAWLYKGMLYLDDPEKSGTKKVTVAYWV